MSVEEHIQALLDGDRKARDLAAFMLRGQRFDPELLRPLLEHPHVSRQVKAIEILRYSRTEAAIELLVGMLATDNPLVARKAASSLGKIGAVQPALIVAALDTATTATHRLNILDVLSRLQHPVGREVLLVHADSWETGDRMRALEYLRRYGSDAPVDTIRGALADPDTRYRAADIAGRIRDPSFLEPMLDIFLASDDWPAWEVGHAIAKFGSDAIEPLLARANDVPVRRVQRLLSRLLWRVDEARLWALWERDVAGTRHVIVEHLATRGQHYDRVRVLDALDAFVRVADPLGRIWCGHAWAHLGVREPLEALRVDPDEEVRWRAESDLRQLANRT